MCTVHSITSKSLGEGERVHGGPVVGRVLGLLRGLLVQVVHGAQGVHGVQGVSVHPVVLHGADWGETTANGLRLGGPVFRYFKGTLPFHHLYKMNCFYLFMIA